MKEGRDSGARRMADTALQRVAVAAAELDTKAPAVHGHEIADVSGLQAVLDGKAAAAHTHSYLPLTGGTLTGPLAISYAGAMATYVIPAGSDGRFEFTVGGAQVGGLSASGSEMAIFSQWNTDLAFMVGGAVVGKFDSMAGGFDVKAHIRIDGTQVVGPRQAAIPDDASGAANQATVNSILAALRAHGLIGLIA